MHYLYIIYSQLLDRYYVGHTSNLTGRLERHNSNHKGFTGKTSDWKIVYTEFYTLKSDAYARERQVKKWKSRKKIRALIEAQK